MSYEIAQLIFCMFYFDNNVIYEREDKDKDLLSKLVLFLLWPFGAWLFSLKNIGSKSSRVIFFLFSCLLLWHMSPAGMTATKQDFLAIMEDFIATNVTTNQFSIYIDEFFSGVEGGPKELYGYFLYWLVHLFTDNYHFLFLIACIPVAYFQLKFLKNVTDDEKYSNDIWGLLVILMLLLPRDIIAVQNPRFTTGMWLCIICTISYFKRNKNFVCLFPLAILPLIHSGMYPYLAILFLYFIVPKNNKILEYAAYVSIPFIFIDADIFSGLDFTNYLPGNIQKWAMRYSSDEYYATYVTHEGRAGFWWVDAGTQLLQKVMYVFMTLVMIRNKDSFIFDDQKKHLYQFYLVLFVIVNFIQYLPVVGYRYYGYLRIFCIYLWFQTIFPYYRKTLLCLVAACLWYMVKRYGYFFGGAFAAIMPPDIFYTPLPYLIYKGFTVF